MTTPVPSALVGPLHRALVEALESVAARDQLRMLLRTALLSAKLDAVPEDAQAFAGFVEGALSVTLERSLGTSAAEMVGAQLAHVLRHVTPAMRRQATGTGDDADEPSGERSVEAVPTLRTGAASRATPTAASLPPLEAPILFPRATSHDSGMQRKRANIARVTGASMPPASKGIGEVAPPTSGPRAVATDVLVLTLDPRLAHEVESRLRGRSRVSAVATLADLMTHLTRVAGARVAIVVDTGVPSIDVPTFASVASALPPGTHVVLWGTNERQKKRVVEMFPQARSWVASAEAESPVDLLIDA